MPTNILEAFVKLFADDSQLRSSFQGLAPQAHLAGITVGDRFAAGVKKSAEAAHAAFQKAFIGPLQSEAFDPGAGRGMKGGWTDQYRASDLATHKGIELEARAHGERLQKIREDSTKGSTGFFRSLFQEPEAGGGEGEGGSGGEGGGHSAMAKFAHMARIIAHDVTPAMSRLNPAMSEFVQTGAASARTAVFFGAAIGGVAIAGAVLSAIIGKYIDRAKEATAVTFEISQALKNLDAGRAAAQFTTAAEGIARLKLSWDQLTGTVKAGVWQRGIAVVDVLVERVSDTLTGKLQTTLTAASANIALFSRIPLQTAQAGERAFNAGLLEREAQLNLRNAKTVEELNAAYDQSVKSIHDRTDAEIGQIRTQLEADTAAQKTGAAALAQIEINKKLGAQAADLAAKELERQRALLQAMDERQAHAVQLGRVTMQADLDFQRAAAVDPRRTLREQQDAETKVFQGRRAYADEYFKYQGNLGKTMWREQIDVARGFLSETVEGSKAWFDQTQKIFDLYKGIREQAQGVFSGQVGTAEGQAAREGKTSISLDEIPDYLRRVRGRDERALGGGRVRIGDLSGAVGRMDLFRTMDREGLSPREAFSRLMEDPSKQLARLLDGVTGGAGGVTPALSGLGDAATLATRAILAMAEAAGGMMAGGRGRSNGAELSEQNRDAILSTNRPFSSQELSTADDSALGRNLFLSAKRGPTTTRAAL